MRRKPVAFYIKNTRLKSFENKRLSVAPLSKKIIIFYKNGLEPVLIALNEPNRKKRFAKETPSRLFLVFTAANPRSAEYILLSP
jgi:hypothetical protein